MKHFAFFTQLAFFVLIFASCQKENLNSFLPESNGVQQVDERGGAQAGASTVKPQAPQPVIPQVEYWLLCNEKLQASKLGGMLTLRNAAGTVVYTAAPVDQATFDKLVANTNHPVAAIWETGKNPKGDFFIFEMLDGTLMLTDLQLGIVCMGNKI